MASDLERDFLQYKRQLIRASFGRMNQPQFEAVTCIQGPLLILAGAGSGKTTVLVNRIANMIRYGDSYTDQTVPYTVTQEDVDFLKSCLTHPDSLSPEEQEQAEQLIGHNRVRPWNILAITFTNKAAGEMKERLAAMLGEVAADINAATFHAACVRILRRYIDRLGFQTSFTIYDTDDSLKVIKKCLKELNLDEAKFSPRAILSAMGRAKDYMQTPAQLAASMKDDYMGSVVARVYDLYQKSLKQANAVDFDDIITLTVRLLQENPDVLEYYQRRFQYIMVDEYQDTNNSQYLLVSMLAAVHKNLCVVGDDDQSIYKFRGATIENILSFEKQFDGAKIIRLEQNYRSTQNILDAANEVIKNNQKRKGKELWTQNGAGSQIQIYRALDEDGEARHIADTILEDVRQGCSFRDHAILYRVNAQSNVLESCLVKYGIPYRIVGGLRFYERKEIKDLIAYLSVVNNPNDTLRLLRIVNEPKRGIGDATMASASEISAGLGISLFEVLQTSDNYPQLSKKSNSLQSFAGVIAQLMEMNEQLPLDELFDAVMERTGYRHAMELLGQEGETRLENLNELKTNILKYMEDAEEPTLSGFLEEIALYTDLDRMTDDDAVLLMTMHSAKGLEFPYVFIAGLEEGIFPGNQALYNPAEVEEERRLAYVGITRAKKRLFLSNAEHRMMYGKTARNPMSRFIKEIPQELQEFVDATAYTSRVPAHGGATPYGRSSSSRPGKGVSETDKSIGISRKVSAGQSGASFAPGDAVAHKVFGQGMVLSATPMGNDTLVEIAFEKVGTKKIMANFARLKKV